MPRVKQEKLSDNQASKILRILEEIGKEKWLERWREHMAFPGNLYPLSTDKDD